jgi:serine/threonine protein kinase
MAPEQALGETLSGATDAWGLGAVMYEALTGRPPFAPLEPGHYEQVQRRAAPVRTMRPRVPVSLARAIDLCLESEPGRRPPLGEVVDLLARVVGAPDAPD